MATLSQPLRSQTFSGEDWKILWRESGPRPEGADGSELARAIEEAWEHMRESVEAQVALSELDDFLDYRPMSPKRTFEMLVELHIEGRGKFMPYPLDFDLLE